jgi:hypothetical protein
MPSSDDWYLINWYLRLVLKLSILLKNKLILYFYTIKYIDLFDFFYDIKSFGIKLKKKGIYCIKKDLNCPDKMDGL